MLRYLAVAALFSSALLAQPAQPAPASQFIFHLEPVRADFTLQNINEAERPVIGQHAAYLKQLTDAGTLIMAGQAFDPKGFWGIVIVEAPNLEAATAIFNGDPAVKSKLFRGTVAPFRIVFTRKAPQP